MLYKILRYSLESVRIAQYLFHFCDSLLACLYLIFVGSFFLTLLVVVLNLLKFLVVKQNLCGTAFIYYSSGNVVCYRFCHGVSIHHLTEHVNGCVYRSTCKSHVSGVRQ